MIPIIDKPSEDVLEKIDFVVQGLENGQFEDLTKKIDFHQKLKGEETKRFIRTLLDVIDAQSSELQLIRQDNMDMTQRISALEDMLMDYTRNMRGIANGLAMLADPPKPLSGGLTSGANRFYNEADAEQFMSMWINKY